MYTGIVQGVETIIGIEKKPTCHTISVSNEKHLFTNVVIGASVAIDGVCLTVTACDQGQATFDVSPLTLATTTLNQLTPGSVVNVERSHISGQENGGHSLFGHIEGIATVTAFASTEQGTHLSVRVSDDKLQYFFHKGFLGLHGCSLTVNRVDQASSTLELNLIPETLRQTNLGRIKPGDGLNFEIDQHTRVLVDTLRRLLPLPGNGEVGGGP